MRQIPWETNRWESPHNFQETPGRMPGTLERCINSIEIASWGEKIILAHRSCTKQSDSECNREWK